MSENKNHTFPDYDLEELLPLVQDLSWKYTAGESTSISYEKAEQLMEAVLYCIGEVERCRDSSLPELRPGTKTSAREAYQLGYQLVLRKAEAARQRYGQLMELFEDYGNRNLSDTAGKGIAGFFLYYDPKFAPWNTIITLDYPVFMRDITLTGIDAISEYVEALLTEQKFLTAMPKTYVCSVLQKYDSDYKNQFYNISAVLIRNLVGRAIVEGAAAADKTQEKTTEFADTAEENPYQVLWNLAGDMTREAFTELCLQALRAVVNAHYEEQDREALIACFSQEIRDFAAAVKQLKESRYMHNIVCIL